MQKNEVVIKLFNLDELLHRHVVESLPGFAGWPPNLERFDLPRAAQSDVLLQGRGAEGPAAIHITIDGPA